MDESIGIADVEKSVEHNGNTYTRADLNRMGRNELRPIARALHAARSSSVSLTWLGSAAQASDLRDFILEEKPESEFRFQGNGFHPAPAQGGDAATLIMQAMELLAANARSGASKEDLAQITDRIDVLKESVVDLVSEATLAANNWSASQVKSLRDEFDGKFEELLASKVTRVELVTPDGNVIDAGLQHFLFPILAKLLKARVHVALVGPAGSGKTKAAHEIAKNLGLPFSAISVGPQTTQSQIMGYMDANGHYVETEFRRRFEQGGVLLLDEFDAANPGVGTCINGATANDGCGFPDRYVLRHPDFICICAMNTFGLGADRQYVGRNQLDAATLDRFAFLEWPYDEALEASLCPNKEWCGYVQAVRKAVAQLKLRHVVSPRASFTGARMLEAGLDRETVENGVIWKGLAAQEITKVKGVLANG